MAWLSTHLLPYHRLPFSGVLGIMATQSNDFAFGIPVSMALYSSTHPEYVAYIYLLAPISLVRH